MGSIVVQEFVTLDGVVQGGGGPDEDREGRFDLGGWQMSYDDEADEQLIPDWEARVEALLLGRKTYDIWAPYWGTADQTEEGLMGDLTRTYNRVTKYVASRTLTEGPWSRTVIVGADLAADVARIKAEVPGEIRVWGSTGLIRSLAEIDAIDEYRLLIHPLVLGRGKKLFADGFPVTRLDLVESRRQPSGITLQILRPAR